MVSHDSQLNIDIRIQAAEAQDSPLQDSDEASLALLLKNQVCDLTCAMARSNSRRAVANAQLDRHHSDTTVQVEGVDEGDAVKSTTAATSTSWCAGVQTSVVPEQYARNAQNHAEPIRHGRHAVAYAL